MSLFKFVARRTVEIVVTLFIIATLIFVLFRVMPGDPTVTVLNSNMTPETREYLRALWGLDKPLWRQYIIYVGNLLRGKFGTSFYWEGDIYDLLRVRLFPTLLLFTLGNFLAYTLGVNLGRIIAWKRGGKLEYTSTVTGLFFYTMPAFWIGLLAIWILSYKVGLFPIGGMKTPEVWGSLQPVGAFVKTLDVAYHLFLPLTVLTLLIFGGDMLLMKNSMLETLREDYVLTARAKGLPEHRIRDHHAARNAMLPVITAFTLNMAFSFNGGVITETIFSWPGLGRMLVQASMNYDYPVAQGAFILLAAVVLVGVLIADILCAYLDPRINY